MDSLDRLRRAAQRRRWTAVLFGRLFAAVGVVLLVWTTVDLLSGSVSSPLDIVVYYALATFGVLFGGLMSYVARKYSDVETARVLEVLGGDTALLEQVEYVCIWSGHIPRRDSHQISFRIAGEQTTFDVYRTEVEPILAYVGRVAPHARIIRREV